MPDSTIPNGQAPTSEGAVTQSEPKQVTDPKMDVFAKKERQLRQMQKSFQAEKAAWEAERAKQSTDYVPKSRLSQDPLAALTEAGITTDKLTEMLLNSAPSQDPAVRALQSKIEAMERAQEESGKRAAEAQTAQYKQAVKQISNEVKMLVDSNSDFDSIKHASMQDAVVALIEDTFNDSGVLMDVVDACKEVEAYLVEEGFKMASLSKVQARLKPKVEEVTSTPPTSKQSSQGVQVTPQIKTVTNSMSQTPRKSADKERRERALAAFYGKLNQ